MGSKRNPSLVKFQDRVPNFTEYMLITLTALEMAIAVRQLIKQTNTAQDLLFSIKDLLSGLLTVHFGRKQLSGWVGRLKREVLNNYTVGENELMYFFYGFANLF